MKNTAIQWAINTNNFYMGCTKVSEGCKKCYMYRLMKWLGKDPYVLNRTSFSNREKELNKWPPSRIFVNSMSDTFHESLSFAEIDEMFEMMGRHPQHIYMILTKRIERAAEYFAGKTVSPNFWIGTSVELTKYLNRIDCLRKINCKVRFVSLEPLLGYLMRLNLEGIQWVIVGGESGPGFSKMEPEWVDPIFAECQKRGVPFFYKQTGGNSKCKCHHAWGCRLYMGRTWDELPEDVL